MSPANKKAYEFAKTICPRAEFMSGKSSLRAAWEIIEPAKRKGHMLSVTRLDDSEVNKIKIVLLKPKEGGGAQKEAEFYLRPDRSGEYYYRSLRINLEKNKDGTIELGRLIADEPTWKMKPSKLFRQL